MPLAAVIATQLTDHTAHPWSLLVGGLDVIKQPGGSGLGTPAENIHLTEEGPAGVSSMEFTIDDPQQGLTIADGAEVTFWNGDTLLFRGFVDMWCSSPAFGGQGRVFHVNATGVEKQLDWQYIPPMTLTGNPFLAYAISIVANAEAPNLKAPMNATLTAPFTLVAGTFDTPIGTLTHGTLGQTILNGDWVWDGGTLREAIRSLAAQSLFYATGIGVKGVGIPLAVTVDYFLGLRVWLDVLEFFHVPADFTNLAITDTYVGATVAEGLTYAADPGDIAHAVYVKGGNAAGSGWFGDGTGLTGREAVVDDSTILTADAASTAAYGYLASQFGLTRGTFDLTDWTPIAGIHPGSMVTITDTAVGLSTFFRIYSIEKQFHSSGRQDWTVSYGRYRPSVAKILTSHAFVR